MRVITDPTIQGMSGRFPKSSLVMLHRDGRTCTHARNYVRPVNPDGEAAFAEKVGAVVSTYQDADAGFVTDLASYVAKYNQQVVDDDKLPLSKYTIFNKGCFMAAEEQSFDITTLTTANFGTMTGSTADVWGLISAAGLPTCGFEAADLANTITGV